MERAVNTSEFTLNGKTQNKRFLKDIQFISLLQVSCSE